MSQRFESIDIIRGVALLGLLTMNLISFSMPTAAYLNPLVYMSDAPLNDFLFGFYHIFSDQKFMGMFSLLFGASVILLSEKTSSSQRSPAAIHYQRNIWLLLIGLAHGFYLWEGDVLIIYAFAALFLYPLKNLGAATLIMAAALFLAYSSYLDGNFEFNQYSLAEARQFFSPDQVQIQNQIDIYQGSYQSQLEYRLDGEESSKGAEFLGQFIVATLFRAFGMMCLGMALYKLGLLQGRLSPGRYKTLALIGLGIGLPIMVYSLIWNQQQQWQLQSFFNGGLVFNDIASPFMVLGYIALIVLWCNSPSLPKLKSRLQKIGQMALTNYLLQSLLATTIFYGYGFGLFGQVSRLELIPIMLAIWAFQLWFSSWWLSRFRQGPVEWLWRSATYFKLQPLKILQSTQSRE